MASDGMWNLLIIFINGIRNYPMKMYYSL